jgi:4-alpha-glucanotransferase
MKTFADIPMPETCIGRGGSQAGVGMHISSLPGIHGIGDIAECSLAFLETLAGMEAGVWQFLPTGPTAYGDSPYQPLSAFAGNANLVGMTPLAEIGLLHAAELQSLEELPRGQVDYGQLIPLKRSLLNRAAQRFLNSSFNGLRSDYDDFLHQHAAHWLDDYALFRALKTRHGERPWPEWEKDFVRRQPLALQKARLEHREEIECTRITQFLFWSQWQTLKEAAAEKDICLFGDMPIYIALDSADAWVYPEILLLSEDGVPSHIAGVPPDYFSEDGQLWGNPLYDWDYHKESGYQWWLDRVKHAASLSDLVRIDHFRGFESFWSVPYGAETARGGEWIAGPGDALFEALGQSLGSLPIVAEDLGDITPEVDLLRTGRDIPGMAVLQFAVADPSFDIQNVEANSVCYTGTHDNDTTTGWFHGTGEDTRTPKDILETQKRALEATGGTEQTIHLDMIRLSLSSAADLAVAPMQDYLGLGSETRLNIPGTTMNNWRWRVQESQLTRQFIDSTAQLISDSSRAHSMRLDSPA